MPQGETLFTRAFLLTVSVKGDLSAESQDEIVRYIKKNAEFHYIVIEFGASNRRHLHACFVFKKGQVKHKLQNNIWTRYVQSYHPDSLPRKAVVVQVMPGNKWYDEYLQKESGVEVVSDTWNREQAEEYFPTPEVQETLMAKSKLKGVACPWIDLAIISWKESTYENTPEGALMYLKDCMFVQKTMIPISDPRKRTEKALMYWEYRNGVVSPSERELFLLRQLQDGPSYDVPGGVRGVHSAAPPSI